MRRGSWLLALAVCLGGCFHQVIDTGRPRGMIVVDRPWVSTWLWGLVAATEVDVSTECPAGPALIVTEQSFANGLVGLVTLGIYTPQHLTVTCAAGMSSLPADAAEMVIAPNATAVERAALFRRAVEHALEHREAVIIRY
jgi:hypothetical protein